jgi:iron-sulfur cluster repair protein YtfE (RIC family)
MTMQPLTRVSHEHHDRLWSYVNQLNDLADCLNCDCLDSARLVAQLPQLREVHDGLTSTLIPHMEAVEAVIYPTLERLLADHETGVLLAVEHEEIRRLVATLGTFVNDDPAAHADRTTVLGVRRVLLRLYALLKAHLSEEALYIPILEDRLTPGQEAALARALDHLAAERL